MATIIRSKHEPEARAGDTTRPVSYTFREMSLQGDDYIDRIRIEAVKIIHEAKEQADKIRHDAERDGRLKATQQIDKLLNEKIHMRMQTLMPAMDEMMSQLDESRGEWRSYWEQNTLMIAVRIAEKLIQREIKETPEISLNWIRDTLKLAANSSEVQVRLHTFDYRNLSEQVEALAKNLSKMNETEIIADDSVEQGGCVVKTKYGEFDMQISSQLERIKEELS